jgi:hypothetical protein
MPKATNIMAIAGVTLWMSGCQSPLVGTWVEASQAWPPPISESTPEPVESNLLIFRSDGSTTEETYRHGRRESSIRGTYHVKRDILIIEDEPMGCISGEYAWRYHIDGDTLVLDDGTDRTTYKRLPPPVCLGDSRRFQ